MRSASVDGLSVWALQNEVGIAQFYQTLLLFFNVLYNVHSNTDFLLYGENLIILVENLIVLCLFLFYGSLSKRTTLIFISCLAFLLLLVSCFPILYNLSIYVNMILRSNHFNRSAIFERTPAADELSAQRHRAVGLSNSSAKLTRSHSESTNNIR